MTRTTLALLVLVPALAQAGSYIDHSAHRPAGPSGIEGVVDADNIPDTDGALAIQGFRLSTNKGRTCSIMADVSPLPDRTNTRQDDYALWMLYPWDQCVTHYNATAHPPTTHDVLRTGNMYVRGVQVCTQSTGTTSERSIRGLKVFYARVRGEGAVVALDDPEVWVSDTGCEKWEERAMCPDGMLAVGMRGHRADWGYRALALRCAAVAYRP